MFKLVVLLVLVGVAFGAYSPQKHIQCIRQNNVDQSTILNFLMNKDYSESDTNLKCLYKCLFFKTGVVNSDGDFSADRLIDNMMVLPEEILNQYRSAMVEHIDNCNNGATYSETDSCNKAFKKMLCFITD